MDVTSLQEKILRLYRSVRGRSDILLLAAAMVLGAGAWAFFEIAELIGGNAPHTLDRKLLLLFREPSDLSDPLGGVAIEEAVRDLTALGGVLVTTLVTSLASLFMVLDRRPRAAAFLAGAVIGGVAITFALKAGFDRARPDLVAHGMEALSASFPSGHSSTAAVVYLTIAAFLSRAVPRGGLRIYIVGVALLITVAVGISRVYLGVHWPTDVLAGWTLGASWAAFCWLLERALWRRGWLESGNLVQRSGA